MIIGLQSDAVLIIAADSRATWKVGGMTKGTTEDHCKIFVVADAAFALAGIAGGPGYDPTTTITEIIRRRTSLQAAATEIADRLEVNLWSWLRGLASKDPKVFDRQVGQTMGDVLIGGIEDSKVTAIRISFVSDRREPFSFSRRLSPCATRCARLLLLGNASPIKEDLEGATKADLVTPEFAERLIRKQASLDPTVGGPIDVLRVDQHGPTWVTVKPHCRSSR